MNYRKLGPTEAEISEIGFGAWGIGGKQWIGAEDNESLRVLRRSFELGVNLVDTALAYGDGHSERLVGEAVGQEFRKVYIATKIPPKNRIWPATEQSKLEDVFPAGYATACTEESLRNLRAEQIYLQQLHVWTDAWADRDEWKREVEALRRSGKVRYFGISASEHEPDSVLKTLESELFSTVQVIYNIFDQTAEQRLFPLCERLRIGVLARVPLDEGGLTGTISEETRFEPGEFRDHYFRDDRKREVVEHVRALQNDLDAAHVAGALPEIALRFCLSHKAVTCVIPGMRRIASVESSVRASQAGVFNAATLDLLQRHRWERNFYQ